MAMAKKIAGIQKMIAIPASRGYTMVAAIGARREMGNRYRLETEFVINPKAVKTNRAINPGPKSKINTFQPRGGPIELGPDMD